MRAEVLKYVQNCNICQKAKAAENTAVGFHSSSPVSSPMERVFIDFMALVTRSKRGNVAILSLLDGFSKSVTFFPTGGIASKEV